MPRRPRIVIPGLPHHVTQRGSRRGDVFFQEGDYLVYKSLLQHYAQTVGIEVLAYCLMRNHVHLIIVPQAECSLAESLRVVHSRYATIVNGRMGWTGHLWQERFFSSPLDEDYLWDALRYVERNPVAAGLVQRAEQFRWSSAKARCTGESDALLTCDANWTRVLAKRHNWFDWLAEPDDSARTKLLRDRTRRDLPCGSDAFISAIQEKIGREVMPKPMGRPKKVLEK